MAVATKMQRIVRRSKQIPLIIEIKHLLVIVIGAMLAAVALEGFLIPHGFLDGGVTGISIMVAQQTNAPFSLILALLNLPFIVLIYIKKGKRVGTRTTIGVIALASMTALLHTWHVDSFTDQEYLALLAGGIILGAGMGLALNSSGALDGMEALASLLAQRTQFSVEQIITGANLIIFTVAGFIMGWEAAIQSAILFLVVVNGIIARITSMTSEIEQMVVTTKFPNEVATAIIEAVPEANVFSHTKQGFSHEHNTFKYNYSELRLKVSRLEKSIVEDSILAQDKEAVITCLDITSLRGGKYEELGH